MQVGWSYSVPVVEHYKLALNHPPVVSSPELDDMLLSATPDTDILTDAPTSDKVRWAILKLKNSCAPGADSLPSELSKCAVDSVVEPLLKIFHFVWKTGIVPAEWRDGIVSLYKGKGPCTERKSHRPITLLSVAALPALNHCCAENVACSNLAVLRTDPHWMQYWRFA